MTARDGAWLVTAGIDGTVRIWDPGTGAERRILRGHTGSVTAVAIAADGTWLATTGDDKTVRIWSRTSFACLALMRTEGSMYCCTWDPAGYNITAGGAAGLYRFTFVPPLP